MKYGLDWPKTAPDHLIDLTIAKKWRWPGEVYAQGDLLNPVSEHMIRAATELFTPKQLVMNTWAETLMRSWVYDDFAIHWGAASCGKSHIAGLCCLLDFIVDPYDTFVLLASTTLEMLELRSFASVVTHLGYLKQNTKYITPLKYVQQKHIVVPESVVGDNLTNPQSCIKGVAVQQGTTAQARSNLQGVHAGSGVILCLDELEGMREAAMEARHNLAMAKSFKLQGLCNPETYTGLAGRYSEPLGGWGSVGLDDAEWETKYGKVYRYDAYKSPGLEDPEKFHFLPTQKMIDTIIKSNGGNEDAPAVWTFLRAFPSPVGDRYAILSEQDIRSFNMKEVVTWSDIYHNVAALDHAFTAGGDNVVLQTAKVGMRDDGTLTIQFDKTFELQIEASSARPVTYQISDQVLDILRTEGISVANLAVDDSGTQSVADVIEAESRLQGVWRCNFASSASEIPIGVSDVPAKDRYKNRVTELYYQVREFAQRGQIRGLPDKAATQFAARRLNEKLQHKATGKRLQLESKHEYKKRTHQPSPDHADACAMVIGLCREKFGMIPGATKFEPRGIVLTPARDPYMMQKIRQMNNLDTSRGLYN